MRQLKDDIRLDPNDRITYRVNIVPAARTTVGIINVASVQRELASAGNLRLQLKFALEGTEQPVVIGDGTIAEVHIDPPARFHGGASVRTRALKSTDREFYEEVETPRTELGVSGTVLVGGTLENWKTW